MRKIKGMWPVDSDGKVIIIEFDDGSIKKVKQIAEDEEDNFEFIGMFGTEPEMNRDSVIAGIFFTYKKYIKGNFLEDIIAYRFIGKVDPKYIFNNKEQGLLREIVVCDVWVEDIKKLERGIAFYKKKGEAK